MLRKYLNFYLRLTEESRPLSRLRPLVNALDTFFYEVPIKTTCSPHIRDILDLKRWMLLVIYALVPCILVAIWNSGVQAYVFGSRDIEIMDAFVRSSETFKGYFSFGKMHFWPILKKGLAAFLPVMFISYVVGGVWEVLFAVIRRHEVSEGFLVTGMLFALILPSTIPYWMVAVGVSAGVVIGKELFGGTGMNILNPALVCRAFLFFAFPAKMTGSVWVGTNPTQIQQSIVSMNQNKEEIDGITQASALNLFNINSDIKRIHIDALGMDDGKEVKTKKIIERQLLFWKKNMRRIAQISDQQSNVAGDANSVQDETSGLNLSLEEKKAFITSPLSDGGLGLAPENYSAATRFAQLYFGQGRFTNGNFFFGNRIGSMGETSILACLLGAFLLIYTRIGSWRSMLGMAAGAYLCALLFELAALNIGPHQGAFNPAKYAFPAYKHLLLGSLAFGLVFMATDPVSSPYMSGAKWIYGILCGVLVIIIRTINPAFPEGVMLAILFGNVFAPLIDHYTLIRRCRARKKIRI